MDLLNLTDEDIAKILEAEDRLTSTILAGKRPTLKTFPAKSASQRPTHAKRASNTLHEPAARGVAIKQAR